MNKHIFYLNDNPEFFETVESDLITWIYKYNGQTSYSVALRELIETNYNLN